MSSSAPWSPSSPSSPSALAPDLSSGVFTDTAPHNVAVSVRGLSKSYSIAKNAAQHTTAGEALMHRLRHPFAQAERETFLALDDVSFDIQKGDVVGIIGRNGAGKSTLLKILSRITEPTQGRIDLYGRVGSLLEVGTGFHPELTGRENIFLNGAILGMQKSEIARQFDAIVDFSGTEQFLDTPVKRYSSGMYVRLAFAVAAHLNPEILIVDEVLAVGDAEFQKKCLGKMKEVSEGGRTVLFVSHNLSAVSNLCSNSIVMERGKLIFCGSAHSGIEHYLLRQREANAKGDMQKCRPAWAHPLITSARLLDETGQETQSFPLGSDITIEMTFDAINMTRLRSPTMGVIVNHVTQGVVGGVNTRMTGFWMDNGLYNSATLQCVIERTPFLQGSYSMDLWLGDGPTDLDSLSEYLSFNVEETDIYQSGHPPFAQFGVIYLDAQWKVLDAR